MNNDLLMNDTLDNFTFTQTEAFFAERVSLEILRDKSGNQKGKVNVHNSFTLELTDAKVVLEKDISLDDSIFLKESQPLISENNKIEETRSILKHNPNILNYEERCHKILSPKNKTQPKSRYCKNKSHCDDNNDTRDKIDVNKVLKKKEKLHKDRSELSNGIKLVQCEQLSDAAEKEISINKRNKITSPLLTDKNKGNELPDNWGTQLSTVYGKDAKPCTDVGSNLCNTTVTNVHINNKGLVFNPEMCKLSSWGLPEAVLDKYKSRKVTQMFPWQVECLSNVHVLNACKNLVYSAPTSAGKTLVAEILAIKTVLERQKKVIFILPFVSIVREKMYYFQDVLGTSGVRVEGFMGSYNPPGGFNSVQVAICTIEKANSLINRLLEDGNLSCIGAILVDEVHLLGDPSRGYLLELLLTKLRYISRKNEKVNIQIIGMSATLPNLKHLAKWLDAELYTTSFRPIPLHEQAHVCGEIYDNNLRLVRKLSPLPELGTDTDNILQLCLETIRDSCSVLIFCPTKNWCENLSQQIAAAFFKIGTCKSEWGELLRSQLNTNLIMELLGQLKYCPVGLDEILRKTVSFGVAFHHAGLTMDERDIIEGAFRNGALRILVATSTLSSGVNLPARRVIIRTPHFHGKPLDTLTYRQMIGRAGRMGKDAMGESFLICQKNDYKIAKELMSAHFKSVESCLEGAGKLKRAILEVIASGVASSPEDIALFTQCTLLAVKDEESSDTEDLSNPIDEAVTFLRKYEFIRLQKQEDDKEKYTATSLGKACLSSSIAPDEGLALFTELEKARQCFVLETELHLIYLVTPYNACNSWGTIDWMFYLELWEKLPRTMKKVGELVGIQEAYIINATRGKIQTNTNKLYHKLLVHKRFFVALALQDLVNEKPLGDVCAKFNCNRGMLQSLQQSASSFAGMVTSFSHQLGWSSVEILISQFQDRLQFGVSRDLLDLMRLPVLNGKMARILYNAGIETVIQLANSVSTAIENVLHKVIPFETEKGRDGESEFDKQQRNKFRNVWVTGKEGLTEIEAAEMLVSTARQYLKLEMGLAEAKWEQTAGNNEPSCSQGSPDNVENVPPQTNSLELEEKIKPVKEGASRNMEEVITASSSDNFSKSSKNNDSEISSVDISNVSSEVSEKSVTKIEDDDDAEANIRNGNVDNVSLHSSRELNKFNSLETLKHAEEISFVNNFPDINLTNIEENLETKNDRLTIAAPSNTMQSQSFKFPQQSSTKNEVSHLLTSASPIDSHKSDSSVFSSPSNLNVSDQIQSDRSLFDDSFTLHLSESDKESSKDSGVKELNCKNTDDTSETGSFLENIFSSSFHSDKNRLSNLNSSNEILACSVEEEAPASSRKRKNRSIIQTLATPSKKKKISKHRNKKVLTQKEEVKRKSEEQLNTSYLQDKLKGEIVADFSKFDIINVCTDESLDSFHKEMKRKKCFALSLACRRIVEKRSVIGSNIIEPDDDVNRDCPQENKHCFNNSKVDGIAVTWNGSNIFYVTLSNPEPSTKIIKVFKTLLSNQNVYVRIFDAKEQIKFLHHCFGVNVKSKIEDPKIADWILEPEGKEKNLQAMAIKYCPEAVKLAELAGGCKGIGSVALNLYSSVEPKMRASVEAAVNWHLMDSIKIVLRDTHPLYSDIYDVEMDTILCLAKMEINGISVNKDLMQKLVDLIKNQMRMIERKAFSLAGRHFNFVSSTEVAKVIGMFRGRKVSTRKQVLEQNEHPISDLVLQWRKINCVLTKMIFPLIRITQDNHIRGCYINHTATGRVTMHEPNLQNIAKDFEVINPITKEKVKISCRGAFQAPDNHCLISADYCQLELRILAHLSKDELLRSILTKPGDVFKSIAAKWNKVKEDKVDDIMRQNTKHICYGIIYGMGSRTLAEQLEIDENEATLFMDTFRSTYPGIKTFIKETIDSCRVSGYVETVSGRRRYLPHINENDVTKRARAERQAVNTTVQGSAADIAKKAMVKIEQELQSIFSKTKNKPKLVLHLHDELMYEVPIKYVRKVGKVIKKNMENCVQLSVPFPVKLKTGPSWGEMTEYSL